MATAARTRTSTRSKAAPTAKRSVGKSKSGFSVKTFAGLNSKRMAPKGGGGNWGVRTRLDSSEPVPVQFYTTPDNEAGFMEYDTHTFKEDGKWVYVPCMGEECPLCDDEDSQRSKTTYRFLAKVYNLKEKKPQLLEGPGDLARRIHYRWSRRPQSFLKRTFEITKLDTQPVTYDVAVGDDPVVKLTGTKAEDFETYLNGALKSYYGETPPTKAALDADDDLDDDADFDEDEDTMEDEVDPDELREELETLTDAKLKARAKKNGAALKEYKNLDTDELIDLIIEQELPDSDEDEDDDEDEEDEDLDDDADEDDDDDEDEEDDEDDDEDDDDEDEDDEPAPRRRAPARKTAAKKAPAKKAPAKKATTRRR